VHNVSSKHIKNCVQAYYSVLGNKSFMLILMLRTNVPRNKNSWGRMFQEWKFERMKIPLMEISFPGTKVLGYDSSSYLFHYGWH